jgi:uncharacterized protein YjbJ (UPF0337 family)
LSSQAVRRKAPDRGIRTVFLKHITGALHMNTDQVKGVAKDIAGKVQEGVGKAVDSPEQQAKGLEKQVEGKGQKALGDAKEVIKGN